MPDVTHQLRFQMVTRMADQLSQATPCRRSPMSGIGQRVIVRMPGESISPVQTV